MEDKEVGNTCLTWKQVLSVLHCMEAEACDTSTYFALMEGKKVLPVLH